MSGRHDDALARLWPLYGVPLAAPAQPAGTLPAANQAGVLELSALFGRRDDMIITGGLNVYPAEVEDALARHPAVLDAGSRSSEAASSKLSSSAG